VLKRYLSKLPHASRGETLVRGVPKGAALHPLAPAELKFKN